MKIKLIVSFLTAASVMSANSFALEIYKGKLLNHKEWTTGTAKAVFKSIKSPALLKQAKDDRIVVDVASSMESSTGIVYSPAFISGSHRLYISNNTQATQTYSYTLSICANTSEHTTSCAYYYDSISLDVDGYAYIQEQPTLQMVFDKPGVYTTFASTTVNTSSSEYYVNDSSNSSSFITISDMKSKA